MKQKLMDLSIPLALALAAAASLGLARFSYALLVPAMRSELGWSYFTAGTMNRANAIGYLIGALLTSNRLKFHNVRHILLTGGLLAALALIRHSMVHNNAMLYIIRGVAGIGSAAIFIAGGLLATRLAHQSSVSNSSLILSLYYGGTGIGIIVSALLSALFTWHSTWIVLAIATIGCIMVAYCATHTIDGSPSQKSITAPFPWVSFFYSLAGYCIFGLGYIGYMTLIILLLREQHMAIVLVTVFYVLLGIGVFSSSWLWASLFHHHKGGYPMALLNGLLAIATFLPAFFHTPWIILFSGALFGSTFLSVVTSTTVLVKHNLPSETWAAGISIFTIVFAIGQIVGPTLTGWLSEQSGGLSQGLIYSALLLLLGSLVASRQKPL